MRSSRRARCSSRSTLPSLFRCLYIPALSPLFWCPRDSSFSPAAVSLPLWLPQPSPPSPRRSRSKRAAGAALPGAALPRPGAGPTALRSRAGWWDGTGCRPALWSSGPDLLLLLLLLLALAKLLGPGGEACGAAVLTLTPAAATGQDAAPGLCAARPPPQTPAKTGDDPATCCRCWFFGSPVLADGVPLRGVRCKGWVVVKGVPESVPVAFRCPCALQQGTASDPASASAKLLRSCRWVRAVTRKSSGGGEGTSPAQLAGCGAAGVWRAQPVMPSLAVLQLATCSHTSCSVRTYATTSAHAVGLLLHDTRHVRRAGRPEPQSPVDAQLLTCLPCICCQTSKLQST
jgi:hypothetical protein